MMWRTLPIVYWIKPATQYPLDYWGQAITRTPLTPVRQSVMLEEESENIWKEKDTLLWLARVSRQREQTLGTLET